MARFGWRRSSGRSYGYGGFAPYVPVATRRADAAKYAKQLAKQEGRELAPVCISGRAITATYWGKAWCENLEAYSDFANRLPRGRTYARNGSVIDLQITKGKIAALVSGSSVYTISISIATLTKPAWTRLKAECSQSITSLIDLLQGRFDAGVMQRLAHPTDGLFPHPKEITMKCSCPDYAGLCKHLAAVLYGVGNRLDTAPEMLFTLRNVDHTELVGSALASDNLDRSLRAGDGESLSGSDLGEIFGIELDESQSKPKKGRRASKPVAKATKATKTTIERKETKSAAAPSARARRKAPVKSKSAAVKAQAANGSKVGKATATAARRKAR